MKKNNLLILVFITLLWTLKITTVSGFDISDNIWDITFKKLKVTNGGQTLHRLFFKSIDAGYMNKDVKEEIEDCTYTRKPDGDYYMKCKFKTVNKRSFRSSKEYTYYLKFDFSSSTANCDFGDQDFNSRKFKGIDLYYYDENNNKKYVDYGVIASRKYDKFNNNGRLYLDKGKPPYYFEFSTKTCTNICKFNYILITDNFKKWTDMKEE